MKNRIYSYLDNKDHKELKKYCAATEVDSVASVIRLLIKKELKRWQKRKK